jgi:hypothetical protein
VQAVQPILEAESSLLIVKPPCKIFGDIHGDYEALLQFFQHFGDPRARTELSFVLLDDCVDRGSYSVNVVSLLFALKLLYPQRIFLLRGNHEACAMCGEGHAYTTLLSKYLHHFRDPDHSPETDAPPPLPPPLPLLRAPKGRGRSFSGKEVWERLCGAFDFLPYAAVVSRTIFCVHGWLPHALPALNQILVIPRSRPDAATGAAGDAPESVRGVLLGAARPSDASFGYHFGADAPPVLTPAQELLWNDAARVEDQVDP